MTPILVLFNPAVVRMTAEDAEIIDGPLRMLGYLVIYKPINKAYWSSDVWIKHPVRCISVDSGEQDDIDPFTPDFTCPCGCHQ